MLLYRSFFMFWKLYLELCDSIQPNLYTDLCKNISNRLQESAPVGRPKLQRGIRIPIIHILTHPSTVVCKMLGSKVTGISLHMKLASLNQRVIVFVWTLDSPVLQVESEAVVPGFGAVISARLIVGFWSGTGGREFDSHLGCHTFFCLF